MTSYLIIYETKGNPIIRETKRFDTDAEALAYVQGIKNVVSFAIYISQNCSNNVH